MTDWNWIYQTEINTWRWLGGIRQTLFIYCHPVISPSGTELLFCFVQARNRPSMDGIRFLLRNTNQVYSKRCQQQFCRENKKQVSTFPLFPAEWQLCTQRVNQRLSQQHPPRIRKQNKTPKLLRQQIVAHVIRNRCSRLCGARRSDGAAALEPGVSPRCCSASITLFNRFLAYLTFIYSGNLIETWGLILRRDVFHRHNSN